MNLSLKGRTYVVMGVANKRSIAWGIARSLHAAGRVSFLRMPESVLKKRCARLSIRLKMKAPFSCLAM